MNYTNEQLLNALIHECVQFDREAATRTKALLTQRLAALESQRNALLAACMEAIRSLDLANDDPAGRTHPLYVKLRDAVASTKGA